MLYFVTVYRSRSPIFKEFIEIFAHFINMYKKPKDMHPSDYVGKIDQLWQCNQKLHVSKDDVTSDDFIKKLLKSSLVGTFG